MVGEMNTVINKASNDATYSTKESVWNFHDKHHEQEEWSVVLCVEVHWYRDAVPLIHKDVVMEVAAEHLLELVWIRDTVRVQIHLRMEQKPVMNVLSEGPSNKQPNRKINRKRLEKLRIAL